MKLRLSRRWKYGYLFALLLTVLAAGCGGGDWSSGDRVLVAKFLYDSGLDRPRRYDVVVFRYPRRPIENGTPKNYIKRLLGLPGELLAIFFGNIYRCTVPVDHPLPEVAPENLWQHMVVDNESDQKLFKQGKFEMLRKSPATMLAMRRIVYDNDYQAKDLTEKYTRWSPKGSDWQTIDKTSLAHGGKSATMDWLRYRHIPRDSAGAKPQPITDFLGYNSIVPMPQAPATYDPGKHNWVGDLLLDCELTVKEARGEFCMELSKGPDRFQACWDLGSGECTLYRLAVKEGKVTKRTKLMTKKTRINVPGTYEVRFANVDQRLTVWVGRDLPFEDGVPYDVPVMPTQSHGPTANDLQPASLGSKGAAVEVRHIKVWRDVYYTLEAASPALDAGFHPAGVDYSDPTTWDPLRNLSFKTIYIHKGHYFCLGDNSTQSSDSRDWGLVPERLMLGRALMVYFPFNRAGAIK